jgi:hypothetical protein
MKLQISNFRGYRYRRYALALRVGVFAWAAFCLQILFLNPNLREALAAIACTIMGVVPGLMFAEICDDIAAREFELVSR